MAMVRRIRQGLFLLGVSGMFLFASTCSADVLLSAPDRQMLEQAIDDYRFGDFKGAIQKLRPLHQRYPANKVVVQRLAQSYEEAGQIREVLELYQSWLASAGNDHSDDARFAWIGMSNALVKLKKRGSAISSLKQWVAYHPDDAVASTMYGSLLVQAHDYSASSKVWDGILKQSDASASDRSAAHYFKALLAYLEGDMQSQKLHAAASIKEDNKGAYAKPAKQLLTAKPARRLGLNASLSVEEYYTSNVELLPDFTAPSPGKKKSDSSTSTALSLTYNLPKNLSFGYIFSGDFHAKRTDLDLAYHSVYGLWTVGDWFVSPKYEYAQLGRTYLFQGGGADAGWSKDGYRLSYGLRYKVFNKNFNTSDLRRLGGFSNRLDGSKSWSIERFHLAFGTRLNVANESTKGDGTFAKSDSYNDFGGGLNASWTLNAFQFTSDVSGYYRKYREAVPLSLLSARSDNHIQLSGNALWHPSLPLDVSFLLKAGWQKNNSNDPSKSYSEWRTGVATTLTW